MACADTSFFYVSVETLSSFLKSACRKKKESVAQGADGGAILSVSEENKPTFNPWLSAFFGCRRGLTFQ